LSVSRGGTRAGDSTLDVSREFVSLTSAIPATAMPPASLKAASSLTSSSFPAKAPVRC